MNMLNPKSWRFGSDDSPFQLGDFYGDFGVQNVDFQGCNGKKTTHKPKFFQPVSWEIGRMILDIFVGTRKHQKKTLPFLAGGFKVMCYFHVSNWRNESF